jgi:hypothetical protein
MRPVINHITQQPGFTASANDTYGSVSTRWTERTRWEVHVTAIIALLQPEFAGNTTRPKMFRLGCWHGHRHLFKIDLQRFTF